tara:strand:+ start:9 stop:2426 length:2418 start_codon:yes stop_codon:yes gene_type:complete
MAESVHNNFPSQVVSDAEKLSYDYGLKIAQAIESEWFNVDRSQHRHNDNKNNFHKLRLYARGEQSIEKYKDELSINGDLSYLNLDWKPVPVIPKFVDIVVNGIAERTYDIKAYSQDPFGVARRSNYMQAIINDMDNQVFNDFVANAFNIDLYENEKQMLPETKEELGLHMQLNYKQSIEIAQEQALNTLLEQNKYELTRKRLYYDLTVIGIASVKTTFNTSEGIKVEYVDPADLVYSYTESPYFEDLYYVGEVKEVPINELAKQFPHLTGDDLEEISKNKSSYKTNRNSYVGRENTDRNKVQVLYFNYKTYMNEVYKVKQTVSGAEKSIEKDDSFNPPKEKENLYTKMSRQIETLFDGALVIGSNKLLKWEISKNMMRPKSDISKVRMNYSIVAPRMYKGQIESLVRRITGFADMIQLTHLKLQQVMSRMTPDGVYLDADGLAEIDLGNGTNYNPQEALNMFFQTGSVIGRSFTSEGDMNPGKIPIQEIASSSGGQKLQSLIANYNYYMQMIRDTTGLNEARDGSLPDKNALVGVQKLAAANSNTATRHILQAGLFLTAETAESLSLRLSDVLEYSPMSNSLIRSIGAQNTGIIHDVAEMYLHEFGIFLELSPDEEEKSLLENNIQQALSQGSIELEDAIDVREIKNLKLANQLLKLRRRKKMANDQAIAERNIQMQAEANMQTQQASAQLEVQKEAAKSQAEAGLEQIKAQFEAAKMMQEAQIKKELMAQEFQYNMQLRQVDQQTLSEKESAKEDRKDQRTKMQATQQSELIDQRKNNKPPKDFESAGNDTLGGGFDLGAYEPR